MRSGWLSSLIVIVIVCGFLVSCASSTEKRPGGARAITPHEARDITQVTARTFDLAEVAPTGKPSVQVKLETTTAQVRATGGFGLWGGVGRTMGLIVVGGASGLAYFPVGALIIVASPTAIVQGVVYDASVKRVTSILAEFNLPARLQTELTERLAAARPGAEETREVVIEVSIARYGFTSAESKAPAFDWLTILPTCFRYSRSRASRIAFF